MGLHSRSARQCSSLQPRRRRRKNRSVKFRQHAERRCTALAPITRYASRRATDRLFGSVMTMSGNLLFEPRAQITKVAQVLPICSPAFKAQTGLLFKGLIFQ